MSKVASAQLKLEAPSTPTKISASCTGQEQETGHRARQRLPESVTADRTPMQPRLRRGAQKPSRAAEAAFIPSSSAWPAPSWCRKITDRKFRRRLLACLRRAEFAIKVDDLRNARGGQAMMLVLYISAVALLSLAFVPDLSL
jgi:hypothetical protein